MQNDRSSHLTFEQCTWWREVSACGYHDGINSIIFRDQKQQCIQKVLEKAIPLKGLASLQSSSDLQSIGKRCFFESGSSSSERNAIQTLPSEKYIFHGVVQITHEKSRERFTKFRKITYLEIWKINRWNWNNNSKKGWRSRILALIHRGTSRDPCGTRPSLRTSNEHSGVGALFRIVWTTRSTPTDSQQVPD